MIDTEKLKFIEANKKEYPEYYDAMKRLSVEESNAALKKRTALLNALFSSASFRSGFSDTKPHTYDLSPGCLLCGQGQWSCLFINGRCNARCFYCPSSQNDDGPPMTHTLTFDTPENYADFISRYQIPGVSFSGGEPLLSFDKVVTYLEAVKTIKDLPVYTWMYTNGLRVTLEKLNILRDNGLDEIRFDLSANHYRLDAIKMAIGIIPRVTVEIPAIPEDLDTTKPLIRTLHDMGVNHLNLHQIRCTPYNCSRLINRGYTFVHGPKVTVLETELTALALMAHSLKHDIGLPINYCSFTYRHQFQGLAARKRYAHEFLSGLEDITPTGHLRHLKITGIPKTIEKIENTFIQNGTDRKLFRISGNKKEINFSSKLWPLIDFSNVGLHVSYSTVTVKPHVSYRFPFKEIELDSGSTFVVEKQRIPDKLYLESEDIQTFGRVILKSAENFERIESCKPYEILSRGLADYF